MQRSNPKTWTLCLFFRTETPRTNVMYYGPSDNGPGKLSRNVGSSLRKLRPTLETMAQAGEIKFYQKAGA